jgi:hypothetical protein
MDDIERCENTPDMFDMKNKHNKKEYQLNKIKYHYLRLRCFGMSVDEITDYLKTVELEL